MGLADATPGGATHPFTLSTDATFGDVDGVHPAGCHAGLGGTGTSPRPVGHPAGICGTGKPANG